MRKKLFYYPGAKSLVVKEIIAQFPRNYSDLRFMETHGGSGIITFHKKPSKIEVFNDLDEGISAVFYSLLFKFEELAFRLNLAQHSESIMNWINKDNGNNDSIVDKAIKKIYLMQFTYSAKGGGISFYKQNSGTQLQSALTLFDLDLFNTWRDRFKYVQILNRDAIELIELFDSQELFIYCDPPYTVTEKGKHYNLNYTDEDHKKLADCLNNMKGKFLLSYDKNEWISELYSNCYKMILKVPYSFKKKDPNAIRVKEEVLIANYPLRVQRKLTEFGSVGEGIEEVEVKKYYNLEDYLKTTS